MLNSIISFVKRKILRDRKERWNYQYAKGQWEQLRHPVEFDRQFACRDYFMRYKNGGSIVEWGCGEGVLVESIFKKADYSYYLGLDISEWAIESAQRLADDKTEFRVADMNVDFPDRKFDVIFYNESINYLENIPLVLDKAIQSNLADGGYFIVSVHRYKREDEIWRDILTKLDVVEEQKIENDKSYWNVKLLKPKK